MIQKSVCMIQKSVCMCACDGQVGVCENSVVFLVFVGWVFVGGLMTSLCISWLFHT